MITALYLSQFEHRSLGIGNQSKTFQQLGKRLGVPANTLKNERDFFDRHVDNHRRGWDVPLTESRSAILNEFKNMTEGDMRKHLTACD